MRAVDMDSNRFAIGQLVDFARLGVDATRIVPSPKTQGPYEILRVLPADDTKPRAYRIKSKAEPFERNVAEHEIVAVG
jgi:hypothetical protein